MNEKTLKFDNIRANKKEFHKSKQPIDLNLIDADQIAVSDSDKFKHDDDGFRYLIGSQESEIVKPLCIILPQMSGYIKYFENSDKNMSFMVKDDDVLHKYNEILDIIKNKLTIKFHSEPIYDNKYIKTKVREFHGVIKTNFLGNKIPKENKHCSCLAFTTIDTVMRIKKKNYPQVFLEECKYRMKKTKITKFINAELETDSDSESKSESDSESKSDVELMAK